MNGKILWAVIRHAGWPKELAGIQGPFLQAYRRYQIHNKSTATTRVYGASANHAHKTDAQVMTADALQ